jgi:carbamoyl-phosphate synthase large subunit
MIRVLVTGVGSLLGQGILKSIQGSALKCSITGTDYFSSAVGLYWVNKGYILPDILKPDIKEEEWIDALIAVIEKENIQIVLPGLDFEIPILARNKSNIEKQTGTILLVSSEDVVGIGDDKWETVNYLKNNGFNYPSSSLPDNADRFIQSNPFPLIVKPRYGHTSENVFLVKNKNKLDEAVQVIDKPIIQEYLGDPEQEYTCGSTFIDNEILSLISLRRILKNGNTQQAFCERTDAIDAYTRKLTISLKPYGPINFQLRLTERGPIVFEINTRFSGTTPIRALFGVNEVEAVIQKLIGVAAKNEYTEIEGVAIRYFENQYIPWDKYRAYP